MDHVEDDVAVDVTEDVPLGEGVFSQPHSRHNSGNPNALGYEDEEADDRMDVAGSNEAATMDIEDLDAQVY